MFDFDHIFCSPKTAGTSEELNRRYQETKVRQEVGVTFSARKFFPNGDQEA